MLGLVLTGHGGFAQGMENALAMIAGPPRTISSSAVFRGKSVS